MTRATKSYFALGTCVTLTVEHRNPRIQLDRAAALIRDYEGLLSANLASSQVSLINRAAGIEPVQVDETVYRLIRQAVLVSRSHKGFNAAIGPLVQLWRIGFDDAIRPAPAAIEACLELVDPSQIVFDDDRRSVFLRRAGMRLDLGAIAKGYIADAIARAWLDEEVERGLIDLGGNILTIGRSRHPDGRWRIGVQEPFAERGRSIGVLEVSASSVVTSGIYERRLDADGHSWHHIIDPRNGYPLRTDLLSATAVASLSTTAEIWSTIAFFNPSQATLAMVPPGLRVGFVLVFDDRTVRVSPELADAFTLTDDSYRMAAIG